MTSVVFMGTPQFAVPSLMKLYEEGYNIKAVITQPDKPQGRHMAMTPPPVKETAEKLGILVFQPDSLRTKNFQEAITELGPDLIITAAYGKFLPQDILKIPKACINVHASLLPRYRGASPVQRCIFNGDKVTGVTIMLMDEGMDTGDIIAQEEAMVDKDITSGELTAKLSFAGAELLVKSLPGFISGKIVPVRQNDAESTTVRPVVKEDGRIDWTKSTVQIHNKVRGCNPWPCAFSHFKEKRLKIIRTALADDPEKPCECCTPDKTPGTLLISPDKGRLFVRCSDGYIEILDLQIEGCRNMPARVCAHNFDSGVVLGG